MKGGRNDGEGMDKGREIWQGHHEGIFQRIYRPYTTRTSLVSKMKKKSGRHHALPAHKHACQLIVVLLRN